MRRVLNAVAALVLGAAPLVAGAPAASAQGPNCALTFYCGYGGVNYGAPPCAWVGSSANYNVVNSCRHYNGVPLGSADNIISSYQNWGTGSYNCVGSYQHANYINRLWFTASEYTWPGNGKVPWVGDGNNDQASSHTWADC